jgi:hypothetical protein
VSGYELELCDTGLFECPDCDNYICKEHAKELPPKPEEPKVEDDPDKTIKVEEEEDEEEEEEEDPDKGRYECPVCTLKVCQIGFCI